MFWADHDAEILWDIQPGNHIGFGYYSDNPFGTAIWNFDRTTQYGTWLSVSGRIYIETSPDGAEVFRGVCS